MNTAVMVEEYRPLPKANFRPTVSLCSSCPFAGEAKQEVVEGHTFGSVYCHLVDRFVQPAGWNCRPSEVAKGNGTWDEKLKKLPPRSETNVVDIATGKPLVKVRNKPAPAKVRKAKAKTKSRSKRKLTRKSRPKNKKGR